MVRKIGFLGILSLVFMLSVGLPPSIFGQSKMNIIGREILNFTLPSTQDRVINYADEYYGKYHLIITFFPAAFTPI